MPHTLTGFIMLIYIETPAVGMLAVGMLAPIDELPE
jgi:hypothetical protein